MFICRYLILKYFSNTHLKLILMTRNIVGEELSENNCEPQIIGEECS